MKTFRYIIEGKEYNKDIDFTHELENFINSFNIKSKIKKTENGFIIEVNTLLENINEFETKLLKKILSLIEIRLYTKKENISKKEMIQTKQIKYDEKFFKNCAKQLRQEKAITIKYNGTYHLVCSASKTQAVTDLRKLIKKSYEPLPVIYKSISRAKQLILLSSKEQELLESENRPFIIAKLRNLHRLEKAKYKHRLTPKVNELNNKILVSISPNKLFDRLFEIVEFPIISCDTFISEKEQFEKTFQDKIDTFIEEEPSVEKPLEILQIIYGKVIPIKYNLSCKCNRLSICLDYHKSNIIGLELKPIKLFTNEQPKYKALSLLFSKLKLEEVLKLNLPFTKKEIKELFETYKDITTSSNSLLSYFDAIASLSDEQLHEKKSTSHSIELAEQHYEVCEEDLYEYEIKDNIIDIDIISTYLNNNNIKHLGSTLVNTISTIITDCAIEKNMEEVNLCGELFYFRDLSELTIEKLDEENIKVTLT